MVWWGFGGLHSHVVLYRGSRDQDWGTMGYSLMSWAPGRGRSPWGQRVGPSPGAAPSSLAGCFLEVGAPGWLMCMGS